MNKTIYTFWLGDENKKQELINYYKRINKIISPWKIELGPSEQEHEYLINNFKCYKKAFNHKVYAFCSDVYRMWKIYENGGLWADAGIKFNEKKIKSFLNQLNDYDYLFVFERPSYFLSGLFYIKKKNEIILKQCLNEYEKEIKFGIYNVLTSPLILSHYIFKKFTYLPENNSKIKIMKSNELDNKNKKNIFYLNSTGSWMKNKQSNHQEYINKIWDESFNSFNDLNSLSTNKLVKNRKKLTNLKIKRIRKIISRLPLVKKIYKVFVNK